MKTYQVLENAFAGFVSSKAWKTFAQSDDRRATVMLALFVSMGKPEDAAFLAEAILIRLVTVPFRDPAEFSDLKKLFGVHLGDTEISTLEKLFATVIPNFYQGSEKSQRQNHKNLCCVVNQTLSPFFEELSEDRKSALVNCLDVIDRHSSRSRISQYIFPDREPSISLSEANPHARAGCG